MLRRVAGTSGGDGGRARRLRLVFGQHAVQKLGAHNGRRINFCSLFGVDDATAERSKGYKNFLQGVNATPFLITYRRCLLYLCILDETKTSRRQTPNCRNEPKLDQNVRNQLLC